MAPVSSKMDSKGGGYQRLAMRMWGGLHGHRSLTCVGFDINAERNARKGPDEGGGRAKDAHHLLICPADVARAVRCSHAHAAHVVAVDLGPRDFVPSVPHSCSRTPGGEYPGRLIIAYTQEEASLRLPVQILHALAEGGAMSHEE